MKPLRYIRISIAAIFGIAAILFFLDYRNFIPQSLFALLHTQFVPAIMSGMLGILLIIFLLTLIFGRLYCSVLCPLGIMQDVVYRFKGWVYKYIIRKKKPRSEYEPPYNILRYGIFGVTFISFIAGSSFMLLLLDPYSNFGRIITSLFKPIVLALNNVVAYFANMAGNFDMYNISLEAQPLFAFLFALIIFISIFIITWRKQRLWCNTMCPVGTFLGFISKYSLFRISLDKSKCNGCKRCSYNCKSLCIDSNNHRIDHSRCVSCFNCLDKCNTQSLSFSPTGWKIVKQDVAKIKEAPSSNLTASRKDFITGTASVMAVAILPKSVLGESIIPSTKRRYPLPPGAVSLERFNKKCTACQLCVSKCPTGVLKPAFLENGIVGIMQPYMYFNVHKYCQFDCKICSEVCPNGAIKNMTIEEKKLTQVGVVNFKKENCVVYSKEESCGACSEHCPTQAVHMIEYKNDLTIPSIIPEICIGCGACESICPIRPDAIFIVGNEVQIMADKPKEDKIEDIKVDDFGF